MKAKKTISTTPYLTESRAEYISIELINDKFQPEESDLMYQGLINYLKAFGYETIGVMSFRNKISVDLKLIKQERKD